MVELTIGDLLRWQPVQMELVGRWDDQAAAIESYLSWAVCIRATTPVLTALRGHEIVIVPHAVLDELAQLESIRWPQVIEHLRTLPIAAVITDHPGVAEGISGVVVIEVAKTGGTELEARLNRAFTERRSDLYQLGSELARSFSSASIGGSDLSGFLRLAGQRAGFPIILLTSTGRRLAASDPSLDVPAAVIDGESIRGRTSWDGLDWISQPLSAAGLPEGVHLLVAVSSTEPADRARLVLEQTSEALGLVFDRLPPIDVVPPALEASEILASFAATGVLAPAARRRLTQIASAMDLDATLRLVANHNDNPTTDLSFRLGHVSLHLAEEARFQRSDFDESENAIISPPIFGIDRLPSAARAVKKALCLQEAGYLPAGCLDLGAPDKCGVLGLLVATESIMDATSAAFDNYGQRMLDKLDSYDRSKAMNLVQTLGVFLDAGASVAVAAERLGIHRNTLAYRLARITDVSGHDLSDARVRFDLQFAIAWRRMRAV